MFPSQSTSNHDQSTEGKDSQRSRSLNWKLGIGVKWIAAVLVLAFVNTWLWPRPSVLRVPGGGYLDVLVPYAPAFYWATWIFAFLVLVMAAVRLPISLLRSVVACLPLLLWGAAMSALAEEPGRSLWFTITWALTACAGAAVGLQMSSRSLTQIVGAVIGLLLILSLSGLAFFPEMAQEPFVRFSGAFIQKQVLGWAAVVFCLVVTVSDKLSVPIRAAAFGVAGFLCLLANSKSALVIQISAVAIYVFALPFVRGLKVGIAQKFLILISPLAIIALVGWLNFEAFVSSLDREVHLSGRVYAWLEFLKFTVGHEWLGLGPGAFSTGSPQVLAVYSIEPIPNWWQSTHSVYLTLFGEVGLIGVALFMLPLLVLAFLRPLVSSSSSAAVAGALTFQLLVGGVIEPTEGSYPTQLNLSVFLILAFHAIALQRDGGVLAGLARSVHRRSGDRRRR